ncbi:MAG: molybdopterin-dependent oxidoreductase [Dehalococcoidales bacterium]|nr:molybdopterin-dependent oxidoreductase [Dehalococcoidales bacterium]
MELEVKRDRVIGVSPKGDGAVYVIGSDAVLNREVLKGLEFLVSQGMFLSEVSQLADVVLLAASFVEKEGTFTNAERRVQLVRKAIEPIGSAGAMEVGLGEFSVLNGGASVEVNPVDAVKLRIDDGEAVRVVSRRGEVEAKVANVLPLGVVSMHSTLPKALSTRL